MTRNGQICIFAHTQNIFFPIKISDDLTATGFQKFSVELFTNIYPLSTIYA